MDCVEGQARLEEQHRGHGPHQADVSTGLKATILYLSVEKLLSTIYQYAFALLLSTVSSEILLNTICRYMLSSYPPYINPSTQIPYIKRLKEFYWALFVFFKSVSLVSSSFST